MESSSSTSPPTSAHPSTTPVTLTHDHLSPPHSHRPTARTRLQLLPLRSRRHLFTQTVLPATPGERLPTHQRRLRPMVLLPGDAQMALVLARSRMRKEDYRLAGKDERTTWAERTMSIITRGKQRGLGQLPILMLDNRERRWKHSRMWRDSDIKRVCYRKIGRVPTHQRCRIRTLHHTHQTLSTRRRLRRWWPLALLPLERESCLLAGNRDILPKEGHTSWITTLAQPHG